MLFPQNSLKANEQLYNWGSLCSTLIFTRAKASINKSWEVGKSTLESSADQGNGRINVLHLYSTPPAWLTAQSQRSPHSRTLVADATTRGATCSLGAITVHHHTLTDEPPGASTRRFDTQTVGPGIKLTTFQFVDSLLRLQIESQPQSLIGSENVPQSHFPLYCEEPHLCVGPFRARASMTHEGERFLVPSVFIVSSSVLQVGMAWATDGHRFMSVVTVCDGPTCWTASVPFWTRSGAPFTASEPAFVLCGSPGIWLGTKLS